MTASEVRKRLAHYYDAPEHADQIRIRLPPGSYVPEFHRPGSGLPDRAAETQSISLEVLPEIASPARTRSRSRWLYGSVFMALAVGLVAWWQIPAPNRALDNFWNPVL